MSRILQNILATIAILFGLLSLAAASSVLTGSDPGYVVYWPLLYFNLVMGVVYVSSGVIAWRDCRLGGYAAALVVFLNVTVLAGVAYLYSSGAAIATESVRAMVLRSLLWLIIWIGLAWLTLRQKKKAEP